MSDELEWEMSDMFSNGLFPFPVYEQNSARRIVRYLLKRGVLDEEIASAIQGSTLDLHAWLNRRGKPMFGEWAMAWMNESRESHESLMQRRPMGYGNGSLNGSDTSSHESWSTGGDSDSDSDHFLCRPEADEQSVTLSTFSSVSGSTVDFRSDRDFLFRRKHEILNDDVTTAELFTSARSLDATNDMKTTLLPWQRQVGLGTLASDSGNVSDFCSCQSKSCFRKEFSQKPNYLIGIDAVMRDQGTVQDSATGDRCTADCKCKLSHYIRRLILS